MRFCPPLHDSNYAEPVAPGPGPISRRCCSSPASPHHVKLLTLAARWRTEQAATVQHSRRPLPAAERAHTGERYVMETPHLVPLPCSAAQLSSQLSRPRKQAPAVRFRGRRHATSPDTLARSCSIAGAHRSPARQQPGQTDSGRHAISPGTSPTSQVVGGGACRGRGQLPLSAPGTA